MRKPHASASKSSRLRQGEKAENKRRGEPSTSSSSDVGDDSSPERDTRINSRRSRDFRTPERGDATDYGLDFGSSRLQRLSTRRCSTLRRNNDDASRVSERSVPALGQQSFTTTPTRPSIPTRIEKNHRKGTKSSAAAPLARDDVATTSSAPKKCATAVPQRRKQLTPVQRDIKFGKDVLGLQNRTDFLVARLPFSRLIRELIHENSSTVDRITLSALDALQTTSELYLTQRLQDAYLLTLHRGRMTLTVKDMALVNYLRN